MTDLAREALAARLDEYMERTYGFVLGTADRDVLLDAALHVVREHDAPPRLLGTGAAAKYLGVHPNSIRNWAAAGLIEHTRSTGPGQVLRFTPEDLDAFATAHGPRMGQGRHREPEESVVKEP